MAKPKRGAAASAKPKLRKDHGPKRRQFASLGKVGKMQLSGCGVLTKYNDYESFSLSCADRGVRTFTRELWEEFKILPRDKQDEFLATIREQNKRLSQKSKK